MGGMTVRQRPSRWEWDRIKVLSNSFAGFLTPFFKDDLHYYIMLAAIPCGLFVLYMNVTVGEVDYLLLPFNWHNVSLSGKASSYS